MIKKNEREKDRKAPGESTESHAEDTTIKYSTMNDVYINTRRRVKMSSNLWRGRLSSELNSEVAGFISSLEEDKRIVEIDIDVVAAHNLMLCKQGLISEEELAKILDGLERARMKWKNGKLQLDPQYVDIHLIIEKEIIDLYGLKIGGKTHLAKSRNDQVMTDVRIYLRNEIMIISKLLLGYIKSLVTLAEKHKETVMPGYTHFQHAQVTTYAHYLLSCVDVFLRNLEGLCGTYRRVNLSPLGASALAGTSFDIDRAYTAELLGFDGILENTIDAVSSRDFALEIASWLAIIMTTFSRIAENLVIWSTHEFNMVELPDEFADISSIMPQKKNPCTVELVRGKTGEVFSSLVQLFTMEKGLPIGYNKDLQETKPPLWRSIDTVKASIKIMKEICERLIIKHERMKELVYLNQITALDLAELLVKKAKISFREAHFLVGNIVKDLMSRVGDFSQLNTEYIKQISRQTLKKEISLPGKDLKEIADPLLSILTRKSVGGPSPSEVQRMIKKRRQKIREFEILLNERQKRIEFADKKLRNSISQILEKY